MIDNTIGFIGIGNMATAIIEGLLRQQAITAKQIWAYNIHRQKAEQLQTKWAINVATDLAQLVEQVDMVILAVKPDKISTVSAAIQPYLKANTVIDRKSVV